MGNATLAVVDRALLTAHLAERGEPPYRADQVWRWTARCARGRGAVLDAGSDARGRGARRNGQGALPDAGRASGGGRVDAVPRRPALALPFVAVRLPADVFVLCDRPDAF